MMVRIIIGMKIRLVGKKFNNGGFMEQNEFDDKIKYAQNIINILQTRLNESVAQNVQLEATIIKLKEELEQTKQEPVNGDSLKTEEK